MKKSRILLAVFLKQAYDTLEKPNQETTIQHVSHIKQTITNVQKTLY